METDLRKPNQTRKPEWRLAPRLLVFTLVLGLGAFSAVAAQTLHTKLPDKPTGYVTDVANLVSPATKIAIDSELAVLRTETGANVAVVVLPTTDPDDPMDVAMVIGRRWGVSDTGSIGTAHRNLGAVILLTPKTATEKAHCRIATAGGAEGVLTDAMAGRICRASDSAMVAGNMGQVAQAVVLQVDHALRTSGSHVKHTAAASTSAWSSAEIWTAVIAGLIVVVLLAIFAPNVLIAIIEILLSSIGNGGSGGSGGSSSGGFSFGGGGGFSGGGGGSDS